LVIKNIINLVKLRNKYSKLPIIEIQYIITSQNFNDLDKIELLAKKLGVDILKLKRIEITEYEWNYLNPD
jgi:MoaA/NifB/PqqE/SkfB family radical SAM enzyme